MLKDQKKKKRHFPSEGSLLGLFTK